MPDRSSTTGVRSVPAATTTVGALTTMPAPDAVDQRWSPRRPWRARPRPGPAPPARPGRSARRSATPRRGAPGSPTASRPDGSRTRIGRSRRSRCRCAGSRPTSSPRARRAAEDQLRPWAARWAARGPPSSRSIAATSASTTPSSNPVEPVVRRPSARRTGAGGAMQVIQLTSVPPPTARADERHDRRVPRHVEAVVEVQPVEGGQLVDGQLWLGDERPRLEHHHRPAAPGQIGGDDATAGPGADDHRVGLDDDRAVAGCRGREVPDVERHDRRWVGGHRLGPVLVADLREAGVLPVLAGICVGQERQQPLQALVRRPPLRDARRRPAEQVALAAGQVEPPESHRPPGEQQVREPRLERPQHQPQLEHLLGIGGQVQGIGGEPRAARCGARDERVGDGREGVQLPGRPADGRGRRWPQGAVRRLGDGHLRLMVGDRNGTEPDLVPLPRRRIASAAPVGDDGRGQGGGRSRVQGQTSARSRTRGGVPVTGDPWASPAELAPSVQRTREDPHTPSDSPVLALLRRMLEHHRLNTVGEVATYIPELGRADPACLRDRRGNRRRSGLRGRRHAHAVHDPVDVEAADLRGRPRPATATPRSDDGSASSRPATRSTRSRSSRHRACRSTRWSTPARSPP